MADELTSLAQLCFKNGAGPDLEREALLLQPSALPEPLVVQLCPSCVGG